MFKLTVFGTGSRGNSALVSDGETNILIDCGIMPHVVQDVINIWEINAVLLTHEHGDHTKHIKHFANNYAKQIYATKGTLENIQCFISVPVEYGKEFYIGTLSITPFPLSHDAAEPCGFFIRNSLGETLVWASDTGTMNGLTMDKPADCYVLEANYDEDEIDARLESGEMKYEGLHGRLTSEFGHLSCQQAAKWLKENAKPESHVILLSPHVEVVAQHLSIFNGFDNLTLPLRYPFSYELGVKCPFI